MNVRILYFWVTLSFSFCTLLSCQTEELYVKEKNLGEKSGIKTEYLKGLEARKAANLLRTKFNGFGGTGQNHNLMREELTEIDYSNILMVMDTLGIKNYVFKIVNHPDDDLKTFHNLVLTDKEGEFALSIMKYHMTDLFAEQYYDMLKKIGEFEGTITSKGLQETDPCEDIVSNYPTPINDDPTTDYTGGGGGYEGSYDGPTFTDGGSDDNSDCIDVSFSILCECGRSYSSWEAYLASICGDGSNPGYDATLVITYDDNCGTNANRCNPDGVIGVI
nr:hypothetical protein [Flavobacterium sp.]